MEGGREERETSKSPRFEKYWSPIVRGNGKSEMMLLGLYDIMGSQKARVMNVVVSG